MRNVVRALLSMVVAVVATSDPRSAAVGQRHVKMHLLEIAGSGVNGQVDLVPVPEGTQIGLFVLGAQPGQPLISTYDDSPDCRSGENMGSIGEPYSASILGFAQMVGVADRDFQEIGSVSVRDAQDMSLLACAQIVDPPSQGRPGNRNTQKGRKAGRPFNDPTEPE